MLLLVITQSFWLAILIWTCRYFRYGYYRICNHPNRISKIKRKPSTVKFGGENEHYLQTNMYGYSILDISHAVRRAMAINSEIKSWG
jgi:hypothetical protein